MGKHSSPKQGSVLEVLDRIDIDELEKRKEIRKINRAFKKNCRNKSRPNNRRAQ